MSPLRVDSAAMRARLVVLLLLPLSCAECGDARESTECAADAVEPWNQRPCGILLGCECDAEGRVIRATMETPKPGDLRASYHWSGEHVDRIHFRTRGPDQTIELRHDARGRRTWEQADNIDPSGEHVLVETEYEWRGDQLVRAHTTATTSLYVDVDETYVWEGDRVLRRAIDERRDGDVDRTHVYEHDDEGRRVGHEIRGRRGDVLTPMCRYAAPCAPPPAKCECE